MPLYTPAASAHPAADAWQPEDALLLPLRDATGEVLALDRGRRAAQRTPSRRRALEVLMAVANHGAAILEQIAHEHAALEAAAARGPSSSSRRSCCSPRASTSATPAPPSTARPSASSRAPPRTRSACPPSASHASMPPASCTTSASSAFADAVLHKPGPLDDAEWREIRRHPETGARILDHAGLDDIAAWVCAHHERVDGGGYPLGLAAERSRSRPGSSPSPTPTRR